MSTAASASDRRITLTLNGSSMELDRVELMQTAPCNELVACGADVILTSKHEFFYQLGDEDFKPAPAGRKGYTKMIRLGANSGPIPLMIMTTSGKVSVTKLE